MGCHQEDECQQKIPRELCGEVRPSQDQVPRDSCLSLNFPVIYRSPVFSLLQVDPWHLFRGMGHFHPLDPPSSWTVLVHQPHTHGRGCQSCPKVSGSSRSWDSKCWRDLTPVSSSAAPQEANLPEEMDLKQCWRDLFPSSGTFPSILFSSSPSHCPRSINPNGIHKDNSSQSIQDRHRNNN